MFIPRSVHAHLVERFIFNFRVRPEVLASHVPVSYLHPQVLHGWSVVSFCLLKLERVMLSPLPSFPGIKTISCAYRCGVLDASHVEPTPSVYILERYTDHCMISHLGPLIFSDSMPTIRTSLTRKGPVTTLLVNHLDGCPLFAASVQSSAHPSELDSRVFDTLGSFVHFIQQGVSSYTPAIYGDTLARVDLEKADTYYESLAASVEYSSLESQWPYAELLFDSAVRATGGLYKWTYCGLVERSSFGCVAKKALLW